MGLITGYASLQTELANYLARSSIATDAPGLIQLFEERFYREPKNWTAWMESALNVTITNSLGPVPTDYLGLKSVYISGQNGPPLKRMSVEQLLQRYPRATSSGQAAYVSRQGANFIFGPNVSSGTLVGTYYAKPVLLRNFASDAAANWLVVNAPDLLLYGSLLEAEVFLKNDSRLITWKAFYDDAVSTYRGRFKEEDFLAPVQVAG